MAFHADWSETVPLHQQRTVSQFKTRRDGGQFTQPLRIFPGTAPGKKRIRKINSTSASRRPCPAPDPARRARLRALSASPGVLIGLVRSRRSGMAHTAYILCSSPTAVLVNRLKTVFVCIAGLSRPRLPTFMNSGGLVIRTQTIVGTGRLARADPAA